MDFEAWEKRPLGYRVDDLTGSVSVPRLDHYVTEFPESQRVEQGPRTGRPFLGFSSKGLCLASHGHAPRNHQVGENHQFS